LGALGRTHPAAKVVVIGGGYGGATCAKYIRKLAPGIEVTLVEQNKNYVTCPFSNTVIGGLKKIEDITHSYDQLQKNHGVMVVNVPDYCLDEVAVQALALIMAVFRKTVSLNNSVKSGKWDFGLFRPIRRLAGLTRLFTGYVVGALAFLAGIIISIVEATGHRFYPPPEGVDLSDPAALRAMMAEAPVGA